MNKVNNMDTLGRILIADQDRHVLLTTTELLQREGYQCTPVMDGFEAMQTLEADKFDLLIAEIHMPGNEELELVQAATRAAEGMSVILFTGHPSLNSAISSIQLHVTAYLIKPVEFDVLLDHVKRSVAKYQAFNRTGGIPERFQNLQGKTDRINFLTSVIQETIEELESTRSSFKSKKLAALRRKLERLLTTLQPE